MPATHRILPALLPFDESLSSVDSERRIGCADGRPHVSRPAWAEVTDTDARLLATRRRFALLEAAGGRPRYYRTKHGTLAVMDTARIGRHQPTRPRCPTCGRRLTNPHHK